MRLQLLQARSALGYTRHARKSRRSINSRSNSGNINDSHSLPEFQIHSRPAGHWSEWRHSLVSAHMSGAFALAHMVHNVAFSSPGMLHSGTARPQPSQRWEPWEPLSISSSIDAAFSRVAVLLRRPPAGVEVFCCTGVVGPLLPWLSLRRFGPLDWLSEPRARSMCHWRRQAITRLMCERKDWTPWSLHACGNSPHEQEGPSPPQ